MYTEVAEKLLHRESGMGGVRREFLLKALRFYEEEAAELGNDPDTSLRVAWANKRAGRIHWANGEHDKALRAYDRAVGIAERLVAEDPAAPDRRSVLAAFCHERSWILVALNRREAARADRQHAGAICERLVQEYPENSGYRSQVAAVATTIGELADDPAQAERLFRHGLAVVEQLVRDYPTHPDGQLHIAFTCSRLGYQLAGRGRGGEAREQLERAVPIWRTLTAGPGSHPEHLYMLGKSLTYLGELRALQDRTDETAWADLDEARTIFRRLATDHPDRMFQGLTPVGTTFAKLGRLDDAITCYREAIRLSVGEPRTHLLLAGCLIRSGDMAGARSAYLGAVAARPDDPECHNALAWFLATSTDERVRDPVGAAAAAKKAVELQPKTGAYWNTLGVALYRNGDWRGAAEALQKSVELSKGGDGFDWFVLAMCHWQLGEAATARMWYARAVAWMNRHELLDPELRRFRSEAADLLGVLAPPPRLKQAP